MAIGVSDELLGMFVPIAVYWLYSGLYVAVDGVERLDGYRLHPKEDEAAKNVVSKCTVVRGILIQQAFQVAVSLTLFAAIGDESGTGQKQPPTLTANTSAGIPAQMRLGLLSPLYLRRLFERMGATYIKLGQIPRRSLLLTILIQVLSTICKVKMQNRQTTFSILSFMTTLLAKEFFVCCLWDGLVRRHTARI